MASRVILDQPRQHRLAVMEVTDAEVEAACEAFHQGYVLSWGGYEEKFKIIGRQDMRRALEAAASVRANANR